MSGFAIREQQQAEAAVRAYVERCEAMAEPHEHEGPHVLLYVTQWEMSLVERDGSLSWDDRPSCLRRDERDFADEIEFAQVSAYNNVDDALA